MDVPRPVLELHGVAESVTHPEGGLILGGDGLPQALDLVLVLVDAGGDHQLLLLQLLPALEEDGVALGVHVVHGGVLQHIVALEQLLLGGHHLLPLVVQLLFVPEGPLVELVPVAHLSGHTLLAHAVVAVVCDEHVVHFLFFEQVAAHRAWLVMV